MNLFKFAVLLEKGNKTMFDYTVQEQYAYMDSLGEPKDDLDRSYKQFKCQLFFWPTWKRWVWWSFAIVGIPIAMLIFWLKGLLIHFETEVETMGEDKGMDEVIPEALSSQYSIDKVAWHAGAGLTSDDLSYIVRKLFGWHHPYYILKSILYITSFSARITRHRPKRFIVHDEFSFCSSLLTDYCHHRGVKVINVQHGEKLRFIRDSFFHFDECYVWMDYYVKMLTRQYAEPKQFRIAVPRSLKIDVNKHRNELFYADYKYYLAIYSEDQLKKVVESMGFAKKKGLIVKYRPHPRYSDMDLLRKYVSEDNIEMPQEVGIEESISNLRYAVGSYTTVLLQAHFSGKRVLLDDVSFKNQYDQLKEHGYILSEEIAGIDKLSDMK